ncbi:MAG: hypothetical protein WB475_17255 [Pseudolabrys sp.]
MVIPADDSVIENEIEQIGHLLEIGWDIRIVAAQMHVVERNMDDMLDLAARRL